MEAAQTDVTAELAAFIEDFNADRVPDGVLTQAKFCLIDSIACALGARSTETGQKLLAFAQRQGGPPEAHLWGDFDCVSVPMACWVNSSLSNLLDMDDTFAGFAHIGNAVFPTAIAVGELVGASGREVLTAVVVGYEVAARIGLALWPSPAVEKMYGIQPTWKVFGAVATASNLLNLSQYEIMQAMGLAGTCAPLPMTRLKGHMFPRGWYKNSHGWGAFTGSFWTMLAREGVLGANTILDGDGGFWRIAGSDRCDFETMTRGLGDAFHILEAEFKPYPACRWSHSAIDAFQVILEEQSLNWEDIESIDVTCFKGSELANQHPHDIMDAPFSIPHIFAMVALGKPASVDWLLKENIEDPTARQFAEKIHVATDEEAEQLFADSRGQVLLSNVAVITRFGDRFTRRALYPRGTPHKNPMTEGDLLRKFDVLTSRVLDESARHSVRDALLNLEDVAQISAAIQTLPSGQ